jgi:lipopolysaccharide/colanic/teichoic acid biosynthesis glycosyltransferase
MRESPSLAVGTGTVEEQASAVRVPAAAKAIWPHRPAPRWRYMLLRRFLACADVAAALLATVALVVVGTGDAGQLAWGLFFLPTWIVIAKLLGLYDRDERSLRHLTVDEIPQILPWALIGTAGLSIFLEVTPPDRPDAASAVIAGFVAAVTAIALRASARWSWRLVTPPERVGIIATSGGANAVKRKLELFPDLHMTVVEEREASVPTANDALKWLAGVDRLILVPSSLDDDDVRPIIETARDFGAMLSIIPPGRSAFSSARLGRLADLPVLEYRTGDLSRSTMFLKRALDVAVSATALVVLSPVFLGIAIAIKADSRGPVFFTQWRAGRGGVRFRMHKFRTMVRNAEELLPQLVRVEELAEPVFKLESDPRTTRVGRALRRWSLDELPQLFDVLRGQMGLVGPRPEQIEFVERYSPEQRLRLLVKPGLTGPMQVYGRGALGLDERLAVEADYIENLSVGRDLRLLGMTVATVFRGRGAF